MSAERSFPKVTRKGLLARVRQEAGRDIGREGRKSAAENPERHLRVKVTMNFDGDLIQHFKTRAAKEGRSYQVLMNDALREYLRGSREEQVAKSVAKLLGEDQTFLGTLAEILRERES